MDVPRLQPNDLQDPAQVVEMLQRLEHSYMRSRDDYLLPTVRRERVAAWVDDARTAAAHVQAGEYANAIRDSLQRALDFAGIE